MLAIATVAAACLVHVSAQAAHAECLGTLKRPSDVWLGVAFVATVVEVSPSGPADWHVELDVGKIYRGDVPDPMILDVWNAGCTAFRPAGLSSGDRLFFAMEKLDLPGNASLSTPLVIWRHESGGWSFADDALGRSHEIGTAAPNYWSTALRDANTLPEILAAIDGLPDTATQPPVERATSAPNAIATLAVVIAFLGFLRALRRPRVTFADAD